jgi:penicillin-binding protein 1A
MKEKLKKIVVNKLKEKKSENAEKNFWTKLVIWFLVFIFTCLIWWFLFVIYLLQDLPTMEELKNIQTKESTQIFDKNWKTLYTIFWDENREVIPFEKITNKTIYWIISLEDENFFEHWWVDAKWLFRAVLGQLNLISYKWWWSTITQQFVKNKYLSSERKYIRKLKEMILSMQLENTYTKEEIVTMYLNQIPFWSNIYWIEQASKKFFWKTSDKLNLVESVVIAAIPNATTRYSPYWNHSKSSLRWIEIADLEKNKIKSYESLILKYWENKIDLWLMPSEIVFKINTWTWVSNWTWEILSWTWENIKEGFEEVKIILPWRTSFALNKMKELWYISDDEMKKWIQDLIKYKFQQNIEKIKAPHFVMYVKEKLEKEFWEEILKKWWLKIFTSLDLDFQEKAEGLVKANSKYNKEHFDAENQSLLSMDTKNWEILAMVWSRDYFDDEIDWQVNIMTSKRLAWSTFKPFAYLSMLLNWYSSYSIIFDTETNFWEKWYDYEPQNFDWKFMWPMSLWKALWESRNIPAIKAGLIWWIEKTYNIAKSMWIKFENAFDWYWASLPLWTVWVQWVDLLSSYMVFANNWEKIEPNAILKIIDQNWVVLKKSKNKENFKDDKKIVLNPEISYLMMDMLSNPENRWDWWNSRMKLSWRNNTAKTWTSNKSVDKPWYKKPVVMPLDWWMVWSTPQYSTIVWSWNNDWKTMNRKWSWWQTSWSTWKTFMEFLHKDLEIKDFEKPEWIKLVKIAKLSWLLPSENTPRDLIQTWYFSELNIPKTYDNSLRFLEIDMISRKLPSNFTPEEAIWKAAVLNLHSLKIDEKRWEEPVQEWMKKYWKTFLKKYWIKDILADIPTEMDNIHTRENTLFWPEISISSPKNNWIIWKWWFSVVPEINSSNWISRIDFYINWKLNTSSFNYPYIWNIKLDNNIAISSEITLRIKAFDELYNSSEEIITLKIWEDDKKPYTEIVRPKDWQELVAWSTFDIKTLTYDQWWQIEEVIFYLDWKEIWKVFNSPFSKKIEIPRLVWKHKIKIIAIDTAWNSEFDEKIINVSRLRNSSTEISLNLPKNFSANKPFDFSISIPYSEIKNYEKIEVFAKKRNIWWQEEEFLVWKIYKEDWDFIWNKTWFFYLNWILDRWNYSIFLKKYKLNNLENNWENFSEEELKEWKNIEMWDWFAVEVK